MFGMGANSLYRGLGTITGLGNWFQFEVGEADPFRLILGEV